VALAGDVAQVQAEDLDAEHRRNKCQFCEL
jgi:hypothetical protein